RIINPINIQLVLTMKNMLACPRILLHEKSIDSNGDRNKSSGTQQRTEISNRQGYHRGVVGRHFRLCGLSRTRKGRCAAPHAKRAGFSVAETAFGATNPGTLRPGPSE